MGLLDLLFKKSTNTSTLDNNPSDVTAESTQESMQDNNEYTECEMLAISSRVSFQLGDRDCANDFALEAYESILNDPTQIHELKNVTVVALALGALMEGDIFSDGDSIKKAVGLTYYFLCRAIKEANSPDPYLYVYRFSTVWEYNKTFYHLLAHSEGKEYTLDRYCPISMASTMAYNNRMEIMQMADAFSEPNVIKLDPALGNIFYETYDQYSSTPSEKIISLGNENHEQVYTYLSGKISDGDFDF